MMRVSTLGSHQSALLNLMAAQAQAQDAQTRLSSGKVAQDLSGYGRDAETVTAMKSSLSRVQSYIDAGQAVAARLTTQALAFEQVAAGADGARQAITNALAAGRVDGLMLELEGQFQTAVQGLNLKHQGSYLFSGAAVDSPAVKVSSLAQLAMTDADAVFNDNQLVSVSRLGESTSVQTGFTASDIAGDLFDILSEVQAFHVGAGGPIDGQMSDAARDFLTTQLARLADAHTSVIDQAARSGTAQAHVDSILSSHENQQLALEQMIGEGTDADMLKAVSDLELAQISIQAAAQALVQLQSVSLLNYLK